ncbi:hypothetical protein FRC16_003740 [Serendipita sp. 398]|nr:hypothetical protein FRC16_003740 [Serendipita sp. 398]
MPRNEQPKSSTLRSRQRITNKTRLRVVHGSIDAETVTIGEDDGRGVLHSTQGVEAEDAAVSRLDLRRRLLAHWRRCQLSQQPAYIIFFSLFFLVLRSTIYSKF